jgi:hypothetical protein
VQIVALALASCTPDLTAAGRVTDRTLLPIAQRTEYYQQALSTRRAGDATTEAIALSIASTASAATQTQAVATRQANAENTAAALTEIAVSTQAKATETRRAVEANDATATATEQIRRAATATAQSEQQATATASVQGTQTWLDLKVKEQAIERSRIVNAIAIGLWAMAGLVSVYLLWLAGRIVARRLGIARYGPFQNPLVLLPNGAVWDPISNTWSGDEVPPDLKQQALAGYQAMLLAQAAHPPYPAPPATKRSFSLGPLSTSVESAPVTESVTVTAKDKPAITSALSSPAIEAPAEKIHIVRVPEGAVMSKAEERLCDAREMIEQAPTMGLTRRAWDGYTFRTRNKCSQAYHAKLIAFLGEMQMLENVDNTVRLRYDVERTIELMGLQNYVAG